MFFRKFVCSIFVLCLYSVNVLAGTKTIASGPKNIDEPYGCNIPYLEYTKAHIDKNAKKFDSKKHIIDKGLLQDFAFKNLPKKKLIVLFNANGKRVGCIENTDPKDKENRIIVLPSHIIPESKSTRKKKKGYTQKQLKEFYNKETHLKSLTVNDPVDMWNTRDLHFIESEANKALVDSDVDKLCEMNILKRLNFFKNESYKGKVDFFATYLEKNLRTNNIHFESEQLFVVGDKTYNPRDYGNYLWGTAVKRGCLSCTVGRIAAHYNNLTKMCRDNTDLKRKDKKCSIKFDSKTDQRAIKEGCNGPYNEVNHKRLQCSSEINISTTSGKNKVKVKYSLASNGSKVLNLIKNGVPTTYVISMNNEDRTVHILEPNNKAQKIEYKSYDALSKDLTDEELILKSLNSQKPITLQSNLLGTTPYSKNKFDFDNTLSDLLKVNCQHVGKETVHSAKGLCEEAGGLYVSSESPILYDTGPKMYKSGEGKAGRKFKKKYRKHFKELLDQGISRDYKVIEQESVNLKESFHCKCGSKTINIFVDKCKKSQESTKSNGARVIEN
jgi:hypothetical protein